MSAKTTIEWTDRTWNPTRGCALVSDGCRNCYAMKFAHRFSGKGKPYEGLTRMGAHGPMWTGEAREASDMLAEPLRWRTAQRVFVNSMSDLFHKDVSDEYIAAVFGVMAACPQHTFQILTKRPERAAAWLEWVTPNEQDVLHCHMDEQLTGAGLDMAERWRLTREKDHDARRSGAAPAWRWPLPNVWIGTSVENQATADERIPHLLRVPAAVRFLSCEPLIDAIDLDMGWCTSAAPSSQCPYDSSPLYPLAAHSLQKSPLSPNTTSSRSCVSQRPGINWVIVGGESGPGARPFDLAWARSIVEQCRVAEVPVFVKQLGSVWERANRINGFDDPKGGDWERWPADLRIREYPESGR